jgi:HlyD family secretion protein
LVLDIARPEFKERKRRRQIVVAALAVVVVTVLTVIVYRLRPAASTVERSTVWTDSVI